MKVLRVVISGAIIGIAFAAAIIVLSRLNDGWDNEALRKVINFSASVPVFYFMKGLNMPELAMNISFFVYWVFLGGIIGWLLSSKKALSKIVLVILIIALVISHRFVQVKIEKNLKEALEGLGVLFRGEAHLKEVGK